MSVATELSKLNTNILNCYDAAEAKEATMPQNKNMDNLPATIASIPAGTPQVTDSRILITEYTPSTGVIKGQNFGNSGKVYLLDRDTHTYNELTTSSYTDTQVTLTSPINTTNIVGTTCFYVAPTGKDISNKQMVFGDLPVPGYGLLYVQDDENPTVIRKVELTKNDYQNMSVGTNGSVFYEYQLTNGNVNNIDIVGFQFGSLFDDTVNISGMGFANGWVNLNQPLVIPELKQAPSYGFQNLYSFDCPVIINTTKNLSSFLSNSYIFNQPIDLSNLSGFSCSAFLSGCLSFNQSVKLSSSLTSIPDSFLNGCSSYNQPIELPSTLTSIGNNFLYSCNAFNQKIIIPSTVTTIGSAFLGNDLIYNQKINLPSNLTSLGGSYLYCCYNYNQPVELPSTLTSIGNYFLYQCRNYNQPINIPSSITSIGDSFMQLCTSFNETITINASSYTIGQSFLSSCTSFNKDIDLTGCTSIGNYFMQSLKGHTRRIVIPSTVSSVGTSFMQNATLLKELEYNASVYPTDSNSLSAEYNSYNRKKGLKIYGTHKADLMTSLPNSTSSAPYRNLIDGNA